MKVISVKELKARIDKGDVIEILDVREPHEYAICHLGGIFIPLGELAHRIEEIDKNKTIAVLCHGGVRSARAVSMLEQAGFRDVFNITGGIHAWSVEIDPRVPIY